MLMYGRKKNKLLNQWMKGKCVRSLQVALTTNMRIRRLDIIAEHAT